MANVQSPALVTDRWKLLPDWWPSKWEWREGLLLAQALAGAIGLGLIAFAEFSENGPGDMTDKAIGAVAICWLFASIIAPIGIFKKKAWGHLLEVLASIPFMILIVRLTSETGDGSLGDHVWILGLSWFMARWLYGHAITGLRLANVLKPKK